jgi:hypothetical protein
MLYLQSTELGHKWTSSTLWRATSCHIFFICMDNQFANENFMEILPPHDLWIRNTFRTVMFVRWKNSFLVHIHVLRVFPWLLTILFDLSTNPMYALQSSTTRGLIAWLDLWVKFPSTGEVYMFFRMYTSHLSFQRIALRVFLTCVAISPPFHFHRFWSNILWHSMLVMVNWLQGWAVPSVSQDGYCC